MKYAVISDVHGNLEALEAVLAVASREKVGDYWCLGDLVGYGANPNECIERLRPLCSAIVIGNHDAVCVGRDGPSGFNSYARDAIQWTAAQLTPANIEWLKDLPYTAEIKDVLLSHAAPYEPDRWHYLTRTGDMMESFQATPARLIFIGHSHQPLILFNKGKEFFWFEGDYLHLEPHHRYIMNVGSVGQPRDGNPNASFAIYDSSARTVRIWRVEYDVTLSQRKIIEAGLPEVLASRLALGA